MTVLLDIILPVFGVIAFGYGATFTPVFGASAARSLSAFVFYFAIPLLLFRNMATNTLPEDIAWGSVLAYYLGGIVLMPVGMVAARTLFGAGGMQQSIIGFGCTYGNTVLLGIPVVLTSFGEEASLPLFLLLAFHSTLYFTMMTVILEIGSGRRGGLRGMPANVLRGLATSPILVSMLGGIAFNLLGLRIPSAIDRWAELMGSAAVPCALFSAGASLRSYGLAGAIGPAVLMTALKLVLNPILVWVLATFVFEMPPLWVSVAVVLSAMPVGVNTYLFADRYNVGMAESASAIFLSTLLSVLTISGLLLALGVGG